jgi:hypothetical protein
MEIVMRVYFEKLRTTIGWKGLINDPHRDDTQDIGQELQVAVDDAMQPARQEEVWRSVAQCDAPARRGRQLPHRPDARKLSAGRSTPELRERSASPPNKAF